MEVTRAGIGPIRVSRWPELQGVSHALVYCQQSTWGLSTYRRAKSTEQNVDAVAAVARAGVVSVGERDPVEQ